MFMPQDKKLTDKCGTPCYIAPEILRNEPYNEIADVFSVGSVFFNLLAGRYLFNGKDASELLQANKSCASLSLIENYLKNFSKDCINLLQTMINPDPLKRPSPYEAL